MGEGQGEGEELRNFAKLFIPLPSIASHKGRGNNTFCEIINIRGTSGPWGPGETPGPMILIQPSDPFPNEYSYKPGHGLIEWKRAQKELGTNTE